MDEVTMTIFLIGVLVMSGALLGEGFKKLKLPAVAGYIVAGLALGPSGANLIPPNYQEIFMIIAKIALGFIAFNVGTELFYKKLKKLGIEVFIISLFESIVPVILITLVLWPFIGLKIAFLLGVFASSTSPAPIASLMQQFKIKGRLIDTTLSITAIDDALGVIYFGIAMSLISSDSSSIGTAIINSGQEILMSVLVGGALGFVLGLCVDFFNRSKQDIDTKDSIFLSLTVVAVLMSVALGEAVQASPILLSLITGAVFTNMVKKDIFDRETKIVNQFQTPFMIVFFGLAGLTFEVESLNNLVIVTIVYIAARAAGKILGAYLGARAFSQPEEIQKNLGLALLPMGGVELGLSVIAATTLPTAEGAQVQALVVISSIIFTLFGSIFAKRAFENAKELSPKEIS
ncbi:cation:proton antiporter [Erysipelotrichaceae bacterium OttesenSCG-928-M19]|nr:cation:proton antiporter [Erysipelotrichaceae bacterium OttesenSCG-928-M19]